MSDDIREELQALADAVERIPTEVAYRAETKARFDAIEREQARRACAEHAKKLQEIQLAMASRSWLDTVLTGALGTALKIAIGVVIGTIIAMLATGQVGVP